MTSVIDQPQARVAPRRKLFQPTTITVEGDVRRAHLLDLSESGAQMHAVMPPARGARLRVACAGELRHARVIWCRGARFGLRFVLPLAPAEVEQAIAADC